MGGIWRNTIYPKRSIQMQSNTCTHAISILVFLPEMEQSQRGQTFPSCFWTVSWAQTNIQLIPKSFGAPTLCRRSLQGERFFFKHFDGWSRVVFFHSEVLSLWRKTKTGLVKFSPDGRAQHLVAPHSTGWEVNLGNCKYDGTSWSICLCSCESQILAVLGTIKASPLHHRFAVWIAAHKTWCQLLGTVSAYIEGHHKANHPDAEHNEERQKPHWPKSMVHWKESNPLKPLTTERNNYDNDIT